MQIDAFEVTCVGQIVYIEGQQENIRTNALTVIALMLHKRFMLDGCMLKCYNHLQSDMLTLQEVMAILRIRINYVYPAN